jgi:hypothetical protein
MTILGPVSGAAQGGRVNPWFSILVGGSFLVYAWMTYFRKKGQKGVTLGSVLFASAICAVFLGLGIWELLR